MATSAYNKYNPTQHYVAESFKDMAVAPLALRQRHDNLLNDQDEMLKEFNNLKVAPEAQDYLNQKRAELQNSIQTLSTKINKVGAGDANLMGEFRNAKRAYTKEVSLAGGVGASVDFKKSIDQGRENYDKYGIQAGWNQKEANDWYDYDLKNHMDKIDMTKLGTEGFSYGDFKPTFAPKKIDEATIADSVSKIMGSITDENGKTLPLNAVYDPIQNRTIFEITDTKYSKGSNKVNIDRLNDYLKETIGDPNSQLMQSERYKNRGMSDKDIIQGFLSRASKYNSIMETTKISDMSQTRIDTIGSNGSGSSATAATPKPTKNNTATLVSIPAGKELAENGSISDIEKGNIIKNIEAEEASGAVISDDRVAAKKAAISQQYRVKAALANPDTIKAIDKNLANLKLKGYSGKPLASKAEVQQELDILDTQLKEIDKLKLERQVANANGKHDRVEEISRELSSLGANNYYDRKSTRDSLKEALDTTLRTSIPANDLLYSRLYQLGYDETSKKLQDTLDATNTQHKENTITYAQSAGARVFLSDGSVGSINDKNISETLREEMKGAKMSLQSILDGGSTGKTQLIYKYTSGTGENIKEGTMYVDYDSKTKDSKLIDAQLVSIQKGLDVEGRAVIQSILDNKKTSRLSIDNEEYFSKGMSDKQNDIIKEYARVFQDEDNSKYSDDVKANRIIRDNQTYNMVLNPDGYYNLYFKDGKTVRDSKNNTANTLNVDGWLRSDVSKRFYQSDDLKKGKLESAATSESKMNANQYVMDFALLSQKDQVIQVDGGSSDYLTKAQNYINQINDLESSENAVEKQYALTQTFLSEIKNKRIAHKNKKRFLQ